MKIGSFIFLVFILTSCSNAIETVTVMQVPPQVSNEIDTLNIGCVGSYEVLENGEEINCLYGSEKIRHGHWITYVLIVSKTTNKMVRAKMEEGYYKWNKRVGFWRIYNQDGTIRDSIEYKNGVALNSEL